MNKNLMFSSESGEWETPPEIFDPLNEEFHFTLDVCATERNTKVRDYFFTKEDDCLARAWGGVCWMNPVYGTPENPCASNREPRCEKKKCAKRGFHIDERIPGIIDFVGKAYQEWANKGVTVVCLLPARTDTFWWHNYVMPRYGAPGAAEVRLVKGRIKFLENGKPKYPAPFPSTIVVFREHEGETKFSSWSPR